MDGSTGTYVKKEHQMMMMNASWTSAKIRVSFKCINESESDTEKLMGTLKTWSQIKKT